MANPVQGIEGKRNPANARQHDHPDKPPGAWVYCHSSNVRAFRYVGAGWNDWLDIEYKDGRLYRYFGVPWSVYWSFVSAPSKGTFRHQAISEYDYAPL